MEHRLENKPNISGLIIIVLTMMILPLAGCKAQAKVSAQKEGENWSLRELLTYLEKELPSFVYETTNTGGFYGPAAHASMYDWDVYIQARETAVGAKDAVADALDDHANAFSWGRFFITDESGLANWLVELIRGILTEGKKKGKLDGTWKGIDDGYVTVTVTFVFKGNSWQFFRAYNVRNFGPVIVDASAGTFTKTDDSISFITTHEGYNKDWEGDELSFWDDYLGEILGEDEYSQLGDYLDENFEDESQVLEYLIKTYPLMVTQIDINKDSDNLVFSRRVEDDYFKQTLGEDWLSQIENDAKLKEDGMRAWRSFLNFNPQPWYEYLIKTYKIPTAIDIIWVPATGERFSKPLPCYQFSDKLVFEDLVLTQTKE
jgi:hypothetical protein